MKVKSYYPVTLTIDGEEIAFRIKRMTVEEYIEFKGAFIEAGSPTIEKFVSRSQDECERDEKGNYRITLEELGRRWLEKATVEQRQEYEKAERARSERDNKFAIDAISKYVTVESGLLEVTSDGSEQSITEGEDILRIFGAREDVLQQILNSIWSENMLSANQKKALKSLTDSKPSSAGQKKARRGQKRKTAAGHVETKASANSGPVNGRPRGRSGSTGRKTAPLSSTTAPSSN